jgi:hypothetical protein
MGLWEREWTVSEGNSTITGGHQPSVFTLVKRTGPGPTCYAIEYQAGELPDAWEETVLVRRGSAALTWNGEKLNPWTAAETMAYRNGIITMLTQTNTNTIRLEGEVSLDGSMRRVLLFIAHDAVQKSADELEDLLIVRSETNFAWTDSNGVVGPIEDGTGHGNGRSVNP